MKEIFAKDGGGEKEKRFIFLFLSILFSIVAIPSPKAQENGNRETIQASINQVSEKIKREIATKEDMLYVPPNGQEQGFWVDKHPVTNAEYKTFVDATKHCPPASWKNGIYSQKTANQPVVSVSWTDASEYAKWAEKRLPTKREWRRMVQFMKWSNNPLWTTVLYSLLWEWTQEKQSVQLVQEENTLKLQYGDFPDFTARSDLSFRCVQELSLKDTSLMLIQEDVTVSIRHWSIPELEELSKDFSLLCDALMYQQIGRRTGAFFVTIANQSQNIIFGVMPKIQYSYREEEPRVPFTITDIERRLKSMLAAEPEKVSTYIENIKPLLLDWQDNPWTNARTIGIQPGMSYSGFLFFEAPTFSNTHTTLKIFLFLVDSTQNTDVKDFVFQFPLESVIMDWPPYLFGTIPLKKN